MTPANLLTQWARLLLSSLADAGVRHVVLSPGSRSAPFMIAAANEPRLTCYDSFDERAGGFFALGQARVTGVPSLCICTSGTAAAHYLPAVVEASLSYVPLVVLTSDRPFELQDAGAAQTIDQIKLMGSFARRFYELGNPDPTSTALSGLRRLAAEAVHFSQFPVPGPVHLNVRARKPLEPRGADDEASLELERRVDVLVSRPLVRSHRPRAMPADDAITRVVGLCRAFERGLIVCGPAPAPASASASASRSGLRVAVTALARATGYPVLAETTSQLRRGWPSDSAVPRCDAFDAVLRSPSFRAHNPPELIVQLGTLPASSGFEQYLAAHDGFAHVVVGEYGWHDPVSSVTEMVVGDPVVVAEGVAARLGGSSPASASASRWARLFTVADRRAWEVIDGELDGASSFDEGQAVRAVVEALPAGSTFMVGNSLPVREVDSFCPSGGTDVTVLCQRGANGIDGLIAGASGSAVIQDRPLTLLLGDVSFLHDLSGLALARLATVPLVVVVLNNGGGRIFEQLPLAAVPDLPPSIMDHVVTPHGVDLEHAALLFGHAYRSAATEDDLQKALDDAYCRAGTTVVEVTLPPHTTAEQHQRIFAGVDAAVSGLTVDSLDALD